MNGVGIEMQVQRAEKIVIEKSVPIPGSRTHIAWDNVLQTMEAGDSFQGTAKEVTNFKAAALRKGCTVAIRTTDPDAVRSMRVWLLTKGNMAGGTSAATAA